MPATGGLRVKGLADLNRALRRTSKDVRLGIRKEQRSIAEPVRAESEVLARGRISGVARGAQGGGVDWSLMRTGLTVDTIYVAPKQRGVKRRGDVGRRRPNLADRLMDDAMQPALRHHAGQLDDRVDAMLGRVANGFSRG